jgi:hypothetical protein
MSRSFLQMVERNPCADSLLAIRSNYRRTITGALRRQVCGFWTDIRWSVA